MNKKEYIQPSVGMTTIGCQQILALSTLNVHDKDSYTDDDFPDAGDALVRPDWGHEWEW